MSGKSRGPLILFGLATLFAIGAWLIGFGTAVVMAPSPAPTPEVLEKPANFSVFTEAWAIVDREFYGEVPAARRITDGAVEGMIESLGDPYAVFLDRAAAPEAQDSFEPELISGVGAWIEPVTDGALVLSVVPDSPAQQSGLQPGDHILAAGIVPLAGMDRDSILNELNGEAGSSVVLVVQRGQGIAFTVETVRSDLDLSVVDVRRPKEGALYVRISSFTPGVVAEIDEVLAAVVEEGVESFLIDLRDNPGGDLGAVRRLAGRLIDGPLYLEVDRQGNETPYEVEESDNPKAELPESVVVIVNEGTAGGAEMLAAALRESAGAHIVGTTTFGKGTIQEASELSDLSLIRLTVAEWRTPGGTAVADVGIQPDETVELTADDLAEGRDPQLEAALRAASVISHAAGS